MQLTAGLSGGFFVDSAARVITTKALDYCTGTGICEHWCEGN